MQLDFKFTKLHGLRNNTTRMGVTDIRLKLHSPNLMQETLQCGFQKKLYRYSVDMDILLNSLWKDSLEMLR